MSKGKWRPKKVDKTLSHQQKLRQFWNHNINPITGHTDRYVERNGGTGVIETIPEMMFVRNKENY